MINLNLGDIATRVRRFARNVGQIPITLREDAFGCVNLVDVSQPPYAQEPRYFEWTYSVPAGAAGNTSIAFIQAAPNTCLVIDAVAIYPIGTGTVQVGQYGIARQAPFPNGTFSLARQQFGVTNAVGQLNQIALTASQVQGANTIGITPTIGQAIGSIPIPAGTAAVGPLVFRVFTPVNGGPAIVLWGSSAQQAVNPNPPGSAAGDGLTIYCVALQATALNIAFTGREYTLIQGP